MWRRAFSTSDLLEQVFPATCLLEGDGPGLEVDLVDHPPVVADQAVPPPRRSYKLAVHVAYWERQLLLKVLDYRFERRGILACFELSTKVRRKLRSMLNLKQILVLPYGLSDVLRMGHSCSKSRNFCGLPIIGC